MKLEAVESKYNEISSDYNQLYKNFYWELSDELTWHYINKHISSVLEINVLDAGCGTGEYGVTLLKKGYRNISFLDISANMLEHVKRRVNEIEGNVKYYKGNICSTEFAENTFDLVISEGDVVGYCTTEHLQAIVELIRITKTNGVIVIGIDNKYPKLLQLLNNLKFDDAKDFLTHGFDKCPLGMDVKMFSIKDLYSIFNSLNVEILDIVGKPIIYSRLTNDAKKSIVSSEERRKDIFNLEVELNEQGYYSLGSHFTCILRKNKI